MNRNWLLALALVLLAGLSLYAWRLLTPGADNAEAEEAVSDPMARPASPGAAETSPAERAPRPVAEADRKRLASGRRLMTPAQHRARLMKILRKLQAAAETPATTGGADPGSEVETVPRLTAKYIKAAIKDVVPLIKECYENALRKDPNLGGKMVVTFEIVADSDLGGLVSTSAIDPKRSDITAPNMRECVRETIYALEFPKPESGGKTKVSYPFRFRAKGQPAPAKKKAP